MPNPRRRVTMPRKGRALLALGLAAAVAVLCLAFWGGQHQSQSRPLTPISSTADWQLGYGEVFQTETYLWLTDHEMLHFGQSTLGGGQQALSYDTRNHADTPEPGLNAVQAGHVISASPDGQWVLWNTQKYNNSAPGMAATHRADGKTIRWPHIQTDRSEGFWLPDSRRWVGIVYVPTGKILRGHPVYKKRLAVYCVDHPGFQAYTIPGDNGGSRILGFNTQGHVILDNSFEGWGGPPGQSQPPLSLMEVSLASPHPTARPLQVPQPQVPPGQTSAILLSPQGDRLLWSSFSVRPSTLLGWLSSWTRHSFSRGTTSLDIWTCHLDGSPPQHIGTWSGQQISFPSAVRWNPDGRHISFTLRGTICSVPVD